MTKLLLLNDGDDDEVTTTNKIDDNEDNIVLQKKIFLTVAVLLIICTYNCNRKITITVIKRATMPSTFLHLFLSNKLSVKLFLEQLFSSATK